MSAIIKLLIVAMLVRSSQSLEFIVRENKFVVFKINATSLVDEHNNPAQPITYDDTDRFTYVAAMIDEPEVPNNWKLHVAEDNSMLFLFGVPSMDDDKLEVELMRYDFDESTMAKTRFKLKVIPEETGKKETTNSELHHLELAFHRINLTQFLMADYSQKLDKLFSSTIWKDSQLVDLKLAPSCKGVAISLLIGASDLPSISRVKAEADRATRAGQYVKLCEFKRSKTISVEHYFRSLGLYPNWCSLKLTTTNK